jgi:hypothetical protein
VIVEEVAIAPNIESIGGAVLVARPAGGVRRRIIFVRGANAAGVIVEEVAAVVVPNVPNIEPIRVVILAARPGGVGRSRIHVSAARVIVEEFAVVVVPNTESIRVVILVARPGGVGRRIHVSAARVIVEKVAVAASPPGIGRILVLSRSALVHDDRLRLMCGFDDTDRKQ